MIPSDEVLNKNFREDLYYRLRSINIFIPPLRERKSDIKILFDKFIENYCKQNNIVFQGIDELAMDFLLNYNWPGNADYFREDERFELIEYELPQYTAVFMNMESESLKDVIGLRSALRSAVDKKSLVEGLLGKVPVEIPLMELNQDDWVSKYDVEAAGKALSDAGYVYNKEDSTGLRYKDGKPLEYFLL